MLAGAVRARTPRRRGAVNSPPMQTCVVCGDIEVVTADDRGFLPDIARRRLEPRCQAAGHRCDPQYRAGLSGFGGPA